MTCVIPDSGSWQGVVGGRFASSPPRGSSPHLAPRPGAPADLRHDAQAGPRHGASPWAAGLPGQALPRGARWEPPDDRGAPHALHPHPRGRPPEDTGGAAGGVGPAVLQRADPADGLGHAGAVLAPPGARAPGLLPVCRCRGVAHHHASPGGAARGGGPGRAGAGLPEGVHDHDERRQLQHAHGPRVGGRARRGLPHHHACRGGEPRPQRRARQPPLRGRALPGLQDAPPRGPGLVPDQRPRPHLPPRHHPAPHPRPLPLGQARPPLRLQRHVAPALARLGRAPALHLRQVPAAGAVHARARPSGRQALGGAPLVRRGRARGRRQDARPPRPGAPPSPPRAPPSAPARRSRSPSRARHPSRPTPRPPLARRRARRRSARGWRRRAAPTRRSTRGGPSA